MSKIEVNKVGPQCGTTVTVGCGAGQTVNVDAATVTLGRCGGSVALASGATQSGFGRSGSVNWQTTPKTTTFTAVNGEGYFINSGSAITMNLPAGSAGAIVAVADYARNFSTYNLTISPNGSEKIGGVAASSALTVDGQAATFVYVDSTKGWVNVQNAEDTETGAAFVAATGGTITCSGDFKIHTFTGPGTFTVTCAGNAAGSNTVDYLVVAGGGSGGAANGGGGGGGAGGLRYSASTYCTPAPAPSAGTAVPVTATAFPITVGAGGTAAAVPSPGTCNEYQRGNAGGVSTFSTITSAGGGGGGGGYCHSNGPGNSGGSGGGGGKGGPGQPDESVGGSGNTPPVSPPQGNDGGTGGAPSPNPAGNANTGGGGGGAGAVGGSAGPGRVGGDGGNGLVISINGSCTAYAGGGGGNSEGQPAPAQGSGGSGGGGSSAQTGSNGNAGSTNTGGGGGGIDSNPNPVSSGAGGSGIVIIRYKYQ